MTGADVEYSTNFFVKCKICLVSLLLRGTEKKVIICQEPIRRQPGNPQLTPAFSFSLGLQFLPKESSTSLNTHKNPPSPTFISAAKPSIVIMSVIYRERERDRDWDTRSAGGRTTTYRDSDRDREGYSVKKIYRIPNRDVVEEDRLSVYRGDDRRSERDRDVQETRIIRRERSPEPEPEPERREIRILREERTREPEPEPRHVEREIRYERDYDRLPPSRGPYEQERGDLQRYSRSVEYFPRPDPPQPIIIRQEPQQIIIQEAPRAPITVPAPQKEESEFQVVHRSEVVDDRQVARRPKSEKDNEEEYYYERRTREVSRDNRGRDDDYEEERLRRRERDVSPGDSISQVGVRDRRRYSSDDSYDYVERRETREGYGSDEGSPHHHRRHLAEGAIAGIGAAELLRHHRKKEGGEEGSRRGRVGRDVGAAALGAIGAEAVTRARSHIREKSKSRRGSRERSRSRDRDGRRRHRHDRSRSRSRSKSRIRKAATLGLGAAAVAAAAAYANKQRKNNNDGGRRSRSRTRKNSVGAPEDADDARNPAHRNKKMAQAGLAGAAVAGLVERARSKSRGGRERSKSRIRTGIPIAAAGLGSAAIAGLYERNQAGKKQKEARREERAARRASRSRSRSQHYEGSSDRASGNKDLIEYGDTPIYGNNGVTDYYNRPASQQGYYNNTEAAMVPAAAAGAGAAYGAPRERERSRSVSSGSDNDRRRRRRHRRHKSDSRSRSRSKGLAAAALGAGVGGITASEYEKRKQRKEEKRERKRREAAERESYRQDPYAQQPYSPPPGQGYPPGGDPYANQPFYPPNPGQPYSPNAEYQPPPGAPAGAQIHPDYGYPPQQPGGYVPPDPNAYPPPSGAAPYANPGQRRADENVSAEKSFRNAPSTFSTHNADTTSNADANTPLYDSNGLPVYISSGEGG
ncbi:MAG: hypothetical protein Q9217_006304 [Psora testacea]